MIMYHKKFLSVSLALASVAVLATGCSKYEDGPGISLVSRTERVANTWVIEKAMADGEDVTSAYEQYVLALTTEGAASLEADYTVFGVVVSTQTTGTWSFANDEEQLVLDFEEDLADGTYLINRLTQTELWVRKVGEDLELRLKEQ
jgi:hypothetical protein